MDVFVRGRGDVAFIFSVNNKPCELCLLLSSCCSLLGLFFYLENGGDMFLRNVSSLSTDYMALYPRRLNSSK
jgi:hypothetical protein